MDNLKVTGWYWKILNVTDSPRNMPVDPGSGLKTLKVTGWYWKILNVSDRTRKMLVDPGSGWNVLEVTEGFCEGGLFQMESLRVLKGQGRSWKTGRSFQFPPNLDQHTQVIFLTILEYCQGQGDCFLTWNSEP